MPRHPQPRADYGQEIATLHRIVRVVGADERRTPKWKKMVVGKMLDVIRDLQDDLERTTGEKAAGE